MIDSSSKHTYIHYGNMRVVKYYGKYDFCKSGEALEQYIEQAQQPDSIERISREQRTLLLAASIVATQFNDGKYFKAEGFSDIVDNEYLKLNFSNKEILIGILTDYPRLLTKEILEDASVILDYLENKLEQLGRVRVGDIVNNKDDEIKHYINLGKIKFAQELREKVK